MDIAFTYLNKAGGSNLRSFYSVIKRFYYDILFWIRVTFILTNLLILSIHLAQKGHGKANVNLTKEIKHR